MSNTTNPSFTFQNPFVKSLLDEYPPPPKSQRVRSQRRSALDALDAVEQEEDSQSVQPSDPGAVALRGVEPLSCRAVVDHSHGLPTLDVGSQW